MVVVRKFTLFHLDCGIFTQFQPFFFFIDFRTCPVTERRKTLEPPVSILSKQVLSHNLIFFLSNNKFYPTILFFLSDYKFYPTIIIFLLVQLTIVPAFKSSLWKSPRQLLESIVCQCQWHMSQISFCKQSGLNKIWIFVKHSTLLVCTAYNANGKTQVSILFSSSFTDQQVN